MRKLTSIAAAGLFAMATGFAGQAQAGHLVCTQVLFANAIFDSDLDCSGLTESAATPVDGLTIGASNVTINLKGFSLIGPASIGALPFAAAPPAVGGTCPAFFGSTTNRTIGIRVDGFDNINILNGIITGFEFGIMVKNAAGVGIKDIEAFNNAFNALTVGDFDAVLGDPSGGGGVPDLVVNRANFHDNRNDAIGVSATSSLSLLNSRVENNCASGIFVAPRSSPVAFGGFGAAAAAANADIKRSSFEGNFRSAVNFWGATGSVQHSLIKGNNADTSFSSSSDFGQISLTNLEGGDISIRCNEIRDAVDANAGSPDEIGIGFRGAIAATAVEVTKNLFFNNPVAIHFSSSGALVTVDIHKNTFDDTNGLDLELVGSNWTVDADKNFYGASAANTSDVGAGNDLTTDPELKSAQHCRGSKGVPQ